MTGTHYIKVWVPLVNSFNGDLTRVFFVGRPLTTWADLSSGQIDELRAQGLQPEPLDGVLELMHKLQSLNGVEDNGVQLHPYGFSVTRKSPACNNYEWWNDLLPRVIDILTAFHPK